MLNLRISPRDMVAEPVKLLAVAQRPDGRKHDTCYVIAGDPACPEKMLRQLSESDSPRIRSRVAENPTSSSWLLARLCTDPHPDVRAAVGENRCAPQVLLQYLADDECPDVRYALAENPCMSDGILIYLCNDDNPYVACRAKKTLDHASGGKASVVSTSAQNHLIEETAEAVNYD